MLPDMKENPMRLQRIIRTVLLAIVMNVLCGQAFPAQAPGQDQVPAESQSANVAVLLDRAQKKLDAGKLAEAQQDIEQVLRRQPDNARAQYMAGVVQVRMNNIQEGIGMIARAAKLDPGNLTYKIALASMYEFVGRIDDAIALDKQILQLADPDSEEYRQARRSIEFQQASQLARSGDFVHAEQQFSKLAQAYPDDFMIRYSLGIAQMLQGNAAEAEKNLLKVIDMNPAYVSAYLSLAKLYEGQGQLDKTYTILKKLVAQAPGSEAAQEATTRMDLIEARLLLAEGNDADARSILEKLYARTPNNPEILFELGQLYERAGDWDAVIKVSQSLVQNFPDRVDISQRLANAYIKTGRYDEAVREMERLLSVVPPGSAEVESTRQALQRLLNSDAGRMVLFHQRQERITELQQQLASEPDSIDLLQELTTLLIEQQRWQDAREPSEHLLQLTPADAVNQTSMGLIYDKLGLFRQAIEPYAKGISLQTDPDLAAKLVPALLMDVAKAAFTDGDLELAGRFLKDILKEQPKNIEAWFYNGLVYYQQDKMVQAIDAFQRVLQFMPEHINARLDLAMSYHRLKREEDAIEEFRNALQYTTDKELTEKITAQMQAVEKSIRGFSGGFSYALAYDSNSNLTSDNPIVEYRTDLAPHLLYRYKAMNGLRWLLTTEPVYSSYHHGEFDFLNTKSTVTASLSRERVTLSAGLSYQVSRGLVNSERSSNNLTYHGEWLGRFKMPQLFHLQQGNRVLTNMSARASYSDFESLTSRFFSAYIYSLSLGFTQPVAERTALGASYGYTLSENKYVEGSDYAYRSHNINVHADRGVAAGVIANAGVSLSLIDYLYPDSVSGYTRYRKNLSSTLYTGISYQFHPAIRLFANLSWTSNSTNLAVVNILNAQDVVEGQQSPVLGDYKRIMLTAGVAMNL